jgi:glycosyltransferase involved in cell wall biosynthesis
MKILYFYQYFTTPKGSYGTRAYESARRWVKAGASVTVVTSVYDKSDLKPRGLISRFNIEGIDVRVINIRISNKHSVPFRLLTFAAYALLSCWYALILNVDVVVSSSPPLTVVIPGLLAHYVRRRPFVLEVRDLWPEGFIQLGMLRNKLVIRLARFFERACYRAATTVVVLSEGMADWIRQAYGVQHLEVVPNAADNEFVDKVNGKLALPVWAKGKQLVLYAGTLGVVNNCGQLLEMAEVFRTQGADDLEIVIIGDGKERILLEKRKQELDLAHVHFLGVMLKEDVTRWLKASCCSLVVLKDFPFLATSSPNKLFDTFAAGVPVVQTTQGWIKRLLEREQCGLTVPANDPNAMADAVLQLARNHQLRASLAANARRVAVKLFDRDLLAEKMRKILVSAAERP